MTNAAARGAWGAALAVVVGVAAALALAVGVPGVVNYDALHHVLWGRDLAAGRSPELEVELVPTSHPLPVLAAAATAWVPEPLTVSGVTAAGYLSVGALVVVAAAIATHLAGTWAGALAALLVATREPVLSFGARAYLDVPFLALALGSLLVALRRPDRPALGLGLLALAGLLRPEAWLFSLAYLAWSRAWRLAPVAVLAPLVWAGFDLAVAGDPLASFTGTREGAEALDRRTGLDDLVTYAPFRVGEVARGAVLAGAAAGVVLLARGRAWLPLAGVVLAAAAFAVTAAAGLPILTRYALPLGVLACVLCATCLTDRRAAAVVLALLVLTAPGQVRRLARTTDALRAQATILADLRAIAPRAARGQITVPNRRPVPSLALQLDRALSSFPVSQRDGAPTRGAYLVPRDAEVARAFVLDRRDRDRRIPAARAGWRAVAANGSWRLLAPGPSATRSRDRGRELGLAHLAAQHRDHPAARVEHERLGDAAHAAGATQVAVDVADVGPRAAEAAQEGARVGAVVLDRHAQDRSRGAESPLSAHEDRRLALARLAPRGPEVQHHHLTTEVLRPQELVRLEPWRSPRRPDRALALGDGVVERALGAARHDAVRQQPDEGRQ